MLGLCEGGLLPGIVIYMAHMYKRHELSQRIAYFYASASLSGAFGGLLAAGFIQIPRTDTVDAGWRWIFIMEGASSRYDPADPQASSPASSPSSPTSCCRRT